MKWCAKNVRGSTEDKPATAPKNESANISKIGTAKTTNARYTDTQLYHKGERFRVGVKILRNYFGDPTTRRISEAVLIDELSAEETMNAKSEWTYVKLNKLSMH